MKRGFITVLILVVLLNGCSSDVEKIPQEYSQEQVKQPSQENTQQTWPPSTNGPWDGKIVLASSEDGLSFTSGETLVEQAGVPNLLLTSDGTIIATYQYFSFDIQEEFDVIAYSVSEDEGKTWTDTEIIDIQGLPEAFGDKHAMDPTLVETEEGGLRLYFTYKSKEEQYVHLNSAYAADGDITSTFVYEDGETPDIGKNMLDPAVVYFDGLWQHYTWDMDSDVNYHSTSEDGVNFELQENIELPMDFLGQVVAVDGGLRFYGSKNGVSSAFSEDGYTWKMEQGSRIQGADPGVVQLEDGSYLMLYTSANFN